MAEIPGYNLSRVIFDATWAAILALNNSIQPLADNGWSLEELITQNTVYVDETISDIIRRSLNLVKFSGLSVGWHYSMHAWNQFCSIFRE